MTAVSPEQAPAQKRQSERTRILEERPVNLDGFVQAYLLAKAAGSVL